MPVPDPNASDWSDLDLLTVGEALGRLDAEIAELRAGLDRMPEAERDAAARRLELLGRARDRAVTGPRPRPDPV